VRDRAPGQGQRHSGHGDHPRRRIRREHRRLASRRRCSPGSHLHVSGYTLLNSGSRNAVLATMSHAHHAGMTISVDGASSAPLACVGAEPFLQHWPADAGLPPALWA